MASTATEDLISELERRYLECNVCTEIFNEDDRLPRQLHCQHTFCSLCLTKICRKESVRCPSCNAQHKLGKHGAIELPKDNVRRDLTSFLQTQESTIKLLRCSRCGNSIRIDVCYICSQCKVTFCEGCLKIHQNKKPLHNLHVKSNEIKGEMASEVCQISEHENAPLKYFCSSCQIGVCPVCALSEHRDISMHHLEDISQAFCAMKASLTTSLDRQRRKILSVRSVNEKCVDMDTALKQQQSIFSDEIDALFNKGVRILNKQKQKLQTRNKNLYKLQQQIHFRKKEKIASFIINAEECYNLSEQIIHRKNMRSFLHVHKTLEHHIETFLNESMENIVNAGNFTNLEEDCDFKMFKNSVHVIDEMTKHGSSTNIQVTDLKFSIHMDSDFKCRSFDNRTVSLMTGTDMICGSLNKSFRNGGVVANITFGPNVARKIEFTIRVQNMTHNKKLFWRELFQFGLMDGRIPDKYPNIFGYICPLYDGICLIINKDVDLTTKDIFTRIKGTTYIEGKFSVESKPRYSSISAFAKTSNTVPLFHFEKFRSLRPVFVLRKELDVPVFVNFDSKDAVEFDRSTLFPSLFISNDNKTVSTISSLFLKPRVEAEAKRSIYASLIDNEVSGPDIRCVIVVDFFHSVISNITEFYEIGFGYIKKGKFIPFTKFKIIKCDSDKGKPYCVQNRITSSSPFSGQLRLVVHYNTQKGVLKVISNTSPPAFNSYKLKYNYRLPVLFLRNINAANIVAHWSTDAYMYEAIFSYLYAYK